MKWGEGNEKGGMPRATCITQIYASLPYTTNIAVRLGVDQT